MNNRPNLTARAKWLLLASVAAGVAGGCEQSKPAAGPAIQPTTPATEARVAATQPATTRPTTTTAPAVPDPREAKFLTNVTQLTTGFDRAGEGYFSADSKWIVFQATPKGEKEYQMYVAPLTIGDGSKPTIGTPVRVSPPNSRNTCGYFSPDGKTLIFGSTAGKEKPDEPSAGYQRQGGNYRWAFPDGMEIYAAPLPRGSSDITSEVFISPSTGEGFAYPATGPTRIPYAKYSYASPPPTGADTRPAAEPVIDLALPANRLTNNDSYDAEGSYSPDGKHICFTSRRSGDTEVWVMKADGSNPVQITNSKNYDGGPFFSPDGKRLIYRSDRKGNDLLQVFVADLAFDAAGNVTGVSAERQLTDDANVNWGPIYHPDNKHVIYATSAHGHHNYELYLMRDDGSAKTRVTYCAGFDGLPVFSPDGKYLMWSAKRSPDGTTQLFIAGFKLPEGE